MSRCALRCGVGAAWILATWAHADPIEEIIGQATLPHYQSHLRILTGVDAIPGTGHRLVNRHSKGTEIKWATDWIANEFGSSGLSVSRHTFDATYAPNLIGEMRGASRPNDIYILGAHYDTYRPGINDPAPGCDDNGSGTAGLMLAARILAQQQFEGTLRFVAFAGEEQGLVGSRAYAKAARQRGEKIVGTLNMDMLLHPSFDNKEPDPDHDLDILSHPQWVNMSKHIADVLRRYTPIDIEVHDDGSPGSDQVAFWEQGYPAVGFGENTAWEIWGGSNAAYHTPNDTMDEPHLEWDFGMYAVQGAMASMIDLAGLVPEPSGLFQFAVWLVLVRRPR